MNGSTVCDLAEISYRQLDYWCRNGVFRPHRVNLGQGRRRVFDLDDARVAIACRKIADTMGHSSTELFARVDEILRDNDEAAWLLIKGRNVYWSGPDFGSSTDPIDGAVIVRVPSLAEVSDLAGEQVAREFSTGDIHVTTS